MMRLAVPAAAVVVASLGAAVNAAELEITIHDAGAGAPLPARVYLEDASGAFHFLRSADPGGAALEFRRERFGTSIEMHTIVSAHPAKAELAPGRYTLTVERGKEYLPAVQSIEMTDEPRSVEIALRRWSHVAEAGWFSGETHVHRTVEELPLTMLAEDLNVALPLTYWVTQAFTPPAQGDKNAAAAVQPELIRVDAAHAIYPMNTEYEIFTVGGKPHTLGAVFALNHKSVLSQGAPPVRPIAERIHAEGGLLELDKHNWPWSMMLVPVMKVDLFELANNHHWRTEFGFRQFGEPPPPYMRVDTDDRGMTERGWTDYGFQNYYALLNCGFRLQPTAGTASGVHPAPLGFGRVYVHGDEPFTYEDWMRGLAEGRSFVTTGPMLLVEANGQKPGHAFQNREPLRCRITGAARYHEPLSSVEIIAAGKSVRSIEPQNRKTEAGAYECAIDETLDLDSSTWIAVRCYSTNDRGRVRFAHTAPFHVAVEGKPLRPRAAEVDYLVRRVEEEITRNRAVLPDDALDEFRSALDSYKRLAEVADADNP
jgi:hypothetical protein